MPQSTKISSIPVAAMMRPIVPADDPIERSTLITSNRPVVIKRTISTSDKHPDYIKIKEGALFSDMYKYEINSLFKFLVLGGRLFNFIKLFNAKRSTSPSGIYWESQFIGIDDAMFILDYYSPSVSRKKQELIIKTNINIIIKKILEYYVHGKLLKKLRNLTVYILLAISQERARWILLYHIPVTEIVIVTDFIGTEIIGKRKVRTYRNNIDETITISVRKFIMYDLLMYDVGVFL